MIATGVIRVRASSTFVPTPVTYEQGKTTHTLGIKDRWSSVDSAPFLMRQPPADNPLDVNNKEWKDHNSTFLKTCWSGVLYFMPEDRCLTNSTVFCPESGAAPVAEGIQTAVSYEKKGQDGDRYLSVIVKSNSTEDMLSVWVRQSERLADQTLWTAEPMPMPTWFIGGIPARPYRDLERCKDPWNTMTCFINYEVNIGKGPYITFFWIGVTGKDKDASMIPYSVHSRFSNFNPYKGKYNPFADDFARDATSHAPSRETCRSNAVMQALAAALILSHTL
jgi:hypothetical protein